MFLAFEARLRDELTSSLTARLEAFAVTQGAVLVKPLWEFDSGSVDRLLRSYADLPDLLRARIVNSQGAEIALVEGRYAAGYQAIHQFEVPLVQRTAAGEYQVGRLSVTFHDGRVQTELADQRLKDAAVLLCAFLLIGGGIFLAVSRLVSHPLWELRDSLTLNAETENRHRLVWTGSDELADVVDAYNRLLAEVDERSQQLVAANEALKSENEQRLIALKELKSKDAHIQQMAYHDSLTGLPNRRLLEDRLQHAIAVAERQGRSIAVLFVDLDHFKVINDTMGHGVGDQLLKIIAGRLFDVSRSMDTVSRWGGDEFVILLENIFSPAEASAVAEKLIATVLTPVEMDEVSLNVGASVGISLYPYDGEDVTTLIKNADMALYEAKAAGRNTLHFFDQTMNARALRRLDLEDALRHSVDNNELELHYQPIVFIADGRLQGLEALVRWRRAGEGLVLPGEFIPLAEENGQVAAIGEWVLTEACRQIRRWREDGLGDIPVAVNLSPRQLGDAQGIDRLIAIVHDQGIAPGLIELEVTEAAVMKDPGRCAASLLRLRDHGFGVAVDDFGTGFSSIAHLRKLAIDTLKIDLSFVQGAATDADAAATIHAITAMANALRLSLVAEGVETTGQRDFLAASACGAAQGHLFAKPMPAEDLAAWLSSRKQPLVFGHARK